jgi:putative nucleotidyltransferase with HDIG domain
MIPGRAEAGRDFMAIQADRAADRLAELATTRTPNTVERAIASARELLGMDVAYVGQFVAGEQVLSRFQGDPGKFGLGEGTAVPLAETFCQRVVDGRLPSVIRDVSDHPEAMAMPIAERTGICAFVAVPLEFSDGTVYGTLCAASRHPLPGLEERDVNFVRVIARLIAEALERELLEEERSRLYAETVAGAALIAAVEARDAYTGRHSRTVVALAAAVARQLGLPDDAVTLAEKVALLHDIGKLAVPDQILGKPGPLDPSEWDVMHRHSAIGADVVTSIPGLGHLAAAIRAEHEHWDGSGYPDGLAGEEIPIASRIVLVCDAYHAMTSVRPYRDALTAAEARAEIERGAGGQFCPRCSEALLTLFDEGAPQLGGGAAR